MRPKKRVLSPISVCVTYAALATFWIWASDWLIVRLELSMQDAFLLATIKGTVFVCITTSVLYVLVRNMVSQIERDVVVNHSLELQFQQAQRMEALGKLAANIAHDSKNQLMVISGYVELLNVEDEKSRGRRDAILKAVEKCDKLNRDLLAYSRKQDTKPMPMKVDLAISGISGLIGTVLGSNTVQQTSLNSGSSINIDRAQLEQVFVNLALNSKDAMPNGGTFRIETSDVKIESEFHDLKVPAGEYVQITVSDTGEGIPEEHFPHLFEPFFTTKERGKGTGLGLAAVYGIVKQSGGFIFVESTVAQSTTFRLLFPRMY